MGTKFQLGKVRKFKRRLVAAAAQRCGRPQCHGAVHFKNGHVATWSRDPQRSARSQEGGACTDAGCVRCARASLCRPGRVRRATPTPAALSAQSASPLSAGPRFPRPGRPPVPGRRCAVVRLFPSPCILSAQRFARGPSGGPLPKISCTSHSSPHRFLPRP